MACCLESKHDIIGPHIGPLTAQRSDGYIHGAVGAVGAGSVSHKRAQRGIGCILTCAATNKDVFGRRDRLLPRKRPDRDSVITHRNIAGSLETHDHIVASDFPLGAASSHCDVHRSFPAPNTCRFTHKCVVARVKCVHAAVCPNKCISQSSDHVCTRCVSNGRTVKRSAGVSTCIAA